MGCPEYDLSLIKHFSWKIIETFGVYKCEYPYEMQIYTIPFFISKIFCFVNSKAKWQYQSYKVYLQKPYLSQAIALVRHVLRWIKGYTLKNKNPNKKDAAI